MNSARSAIRKLIALLRIFLCCAGSWSSTSLVFFIAPRTASRVGLDPAALMVDATTVIKLYPSAAH